LITCEAPVTIAIFGLLAQPLVVGNTVFIVTELNNIYSLDSTTGAVLASRSLGVQWNS
jgi:hypothetical protein